MLMSKNWGEGKRYLYEDILVYIGLFILILAWDPLLNLLIASGLYSPSHEMMHPIKFGAGQALGMLVVIAQLIRKFLDWRYIG